MTMMPPIIHSFTHTHSQQPLSSHTIIVTMPTSTKNSPTHMHSMSIPPYSMCSQEECHHRNQTKDISIFECSNPKEARRKHRLLDPSLAITKYRRSAAGDDRQSRYRPRSIQQLCGTVQYLLELFVARQSTRDMPKQTLLTTIDFVQDRLRAVQVDLVTATTPDQYTRHAELQYQMIKCYIIMLYLMLDCPDYQRVFGHQGLTSALASYWNHRSNSNNNNNNNNNNKPTQRQQLPLDDHVLALATLLQLNRSLQEERRQYGGQVSAQQQQQNNHHGDQDLAMLYRKHVHCLSSAETNTPYPLLQWAIRLTVTVHTGMWHVALRQLRNNPLSNNNTQFDILSRCCLAESLLFMQYQALQAYNVSFAKCEAVPVHDLVRLLQFTANDNYDDDCKVDGKHWQRETAWDENDESEGERDSEPVLARIKNDTSGSVAMDERNQTACLTFGQSLGLPLHESKTALVFKASALQEPPLVYKARNDDFVFGGCSTEKDANNVLVPSASTLRTLLLITGKWIDMTDIPYS